MFEPINHGPDGIWGILVTITVPWMSSRFIAVFVYVNRRSMLFQSNNVLARSFLLFLYVMTWYLTIFFSFSSTDRSSLMQTERKSRYSLSFISMSIFPNSLLVPWLMHRLVKSVWHDWCRISWSADNRPLSSSPFKMIKYYLSVGFRVTS